MVLGTAPAPAVRGFLLAVSITAVGDGLWLASGVLFLTRSAGIPAGQVGVGLLLAGCAGMLAAAPTGTLADRIGSRTIYGCLFLLRAVSLLLFLAVQSFPLFLVAATVYALSYGPAIGMRITVATTLSEPDDRLRTLAQARVTGHVGTGVGGLLGAFVIQADTRWAYLAMLVIGAAAYAAAGLTVLRIDVPESPPAEPGSRPRVWRDGPYLVLAFLLGMLTLSWAVLSVGLPLWVAGHTGAPRWISGAIVVMNAVGIVLTQVRFADTVKTATRAARAAGVAGAAIAVSCLLFSSAAGLDGAAAIAVLLCGGLCYVTGEVFAMAGNWGLSVGLMPESAKGGYQGVVAAGTQGAQTAGPLLMVALIDGAGRVGWLVLAGLFAATGVALSTVARWPSMSHRFGAR